jgi:PAS domain S-box-containing protein
VLAVPGLGRFFEHVLDTIASTLGTESIELIELTPDGEDVLLQAILPQSSAKTPPELRRRLRAKAKSILSSAIGGTLAAADNRGLFRLEDKALKGLACLIDIDGTPAGVLALANQSRVLSAKQAEILASEARAIERIMLGRVQATPETTNSSDSNESGPRPASLLQSLHLLNQSYLQMLRRQKKELARMHLDARQNEAELGQQRALTDRIVSSSQEGILAFDGGYAVVLWNDALERIFGITRRRALGRPIFDLLPFLRETGEDVFFREALEGKSGSGKGRPYRWPGRSRRGFFDSYYSPIWEEQGPAGQREVIGGLAFIHEVTEYKRAQDATRDLSERLLKLQDEERRRIARELHDGLAQVVSAASMYLARVEQDAERLTPTALAALRHGMHMVSRAVSETRSASYLLYPPELRSFGLAADLRMYVEGFGKRTDIEVSLDITPQANDLEEEMALAVFRIVQQCLSNIFRHSGAKSASIRLAVEDSTLKVEIVDNGRGLSRGVLKAFNGGSSVLGVGISGMRDRARQFGGTLTIESDSKGTRVIASLPVKPKTKA